MTRSAQDALEGADRITAPDAIPPAGERPGYEFRSTFELESLPESATRSATAHGLCEAFVNGSRVGDVELAPGSTNYRKTLYVQSYEVAEVLRVGTQSARRSQPAASSTTINQAANGGSSVAKPPSSAGSPDGFLKRPSASV